MTRSHILIGSECFGTFSVRHLPHAEHGNERPNAKSCEACCTTEDGSVKHYCMGSLRFILCVFLVQEKLGEIREKCRESSCRQSKNEREHGSSNCPRWKYVGELVYTGNKGDGSASIQQEKVFENRCRNRGKRFEGFSCVAHLQIFHKFLRGIFAKAITVVHGSQIAAIWMAAKESFPLAPYRNNSENKVGEVLKASKPGFKVVGHGVSSDVNDGDDSARVAQGFPLVGFPRCCLSCAGDY